MDLQALLESTKQDIERLTKLQHAIEDILGAGSKTGSRRGRPPKVKRHFSEEGKERIRAAMKQRWSEYHKLNKTGTRSKPAARKSAQKRAAAKKRSGEWTPERRAQAAERMARVNRERAVRQRAENSQAKNRVAKKTVAK
jgi:hypothetical protein